MTQTRQPAVDVADLLDGPALDHHFAPAAGEVYHTVAHSWYRCLALVAVVAAPFVALFLLLLSGWTPW